MICASGISVSSDVFSFATSASDSALPPLGGGSLNKYLRVTLDPGATSPVAASAFCEISTRGPAANDPDSRSGSSSTTAAILKSSVPSLIESPTFKCNRSSRSSPTATVESVSACASGIAGSNTTEP